MSNTNLLIAFFSVAIFVSAFYAWKKPNRVSVLLLGLLLVVSYLMYQKEFSYGALTQKMYQAFENHQFHQAVLYSRQRLNYAEKHFAKESTDYALALHDVAFTYKSYGCLQEDSEKLFHRALAILEAKPKENATQIAQTYDNLAIVLGFLERSKEAAVYSQKSLALYETIQGPEGYDVYINLTNLAGHYLSMDECVEAQKLLQRSEVLAKKFFPQGHPFDIRSYELRASQRRCEGDLAGAIREIEKAISVVPKMQSDPKLKEHELLLSLASLHLQLKQYAEAEKILLKLQQVTEMYGRGYFITENTYGFLKQLYEETGREKELQELALHGTGPKTFFVCANKEYDGSFLADLKQLSSVD